MQTRGRIVAPYRAKNLVLIGMVLMLAVSFVPFASTYAEDLENIEPEDQAGLTVESPGTPSAVSSTEDKNIVWVWTAPPGGLSPDTPSGDPTEQEPTVAEYPTDIIQFGYELWNQDAPLSTGVVSSDVSSVTTPVDSDGTYILKLWSIARSGATSAVVTGTIGVITPAPPLPPLPPIEEDIIPDPIDTKPLTNTSYLNIKPKAPAASSTINNSNNTDNSVNSPSASVLSANTIKDTISNVTKSGVAKTSSEGWVIVGIPWYIWLIAAAILFMVWRLAMTFVFIRK